ncbi:hypothetical protein CDL15_Pgr008456 [Punica granatum]|uniref:Uncharacterized protein n=1 Tax=Punica granatum TaxID=22663 RepID=A0A218WMX6_PUNGR|nr:hypothetical protein CDL15_Pgr008456 [Punica granatum]
MEAFTRFSIDDRSRGKVVHVKAHHTDDAGPRTDKEPVVVERPMNGGSNRRLDSTKTSLGSTEKIKMESQALMILPHEDRGGEPELEENPDGCQG